MVARREEATDQEKNAARKKERRRARERLSYFYCFATTAVEKIYGCYYEGLVGPPRAQGAPSKPARRAALCVTCTQRHAVCAASAVPSHPLTLYACAAIGAMGDAAACRSRRHGIFAWRTRCGSWRTARSWADLRRSSSSVRAKPRLNRRPLFAVHTALSFLLLSLSLAAHEIRTAARGRTPSGCLHLAAWHVCNCSRKRHPRARHDGALFCPLASVRVVLVQARPRRDRQSRDWARAWALAWATPTARSSSTRSPRRRASSSSGGSRRPRRTSVMTSVPGAIATRHLKLFCGPVGRPGVR